MMKKKKKSEGGKSDEVKGLFEVGLPITVVPSRAPANLGRVAADFPMCRGGAGL